jgi:hypothetical protein
MINKVFSIAREVICEEQHSVNVPRTISFDSKHIDVTAAPVGIKIDLRHDQLVFEEGKDGVLGSSKLSFFIGHHASIPLFLAAEQAYSPNLQNVPPS